MFMCFGEGDWDLFPLRTINGEAANGMPTDRHLPVLLAPERFITVFTKDNHWVLAGSRFSQPWP
jgi:hypothetical protein